MYKIIKDLTHNLLILGVKIYHYDKPHFKGKTAY